MNWFERLTGFPETSWSDTRSKFEVEGRFLRSRVDGRRWAIGELELASLSDLRERARAGDGPVGRLRASIARGDVRAMHREPANAGALFQVASQFNLLEMVGPDVTPEDGVARYDHDSTQGPACAKAAGAATLYRNYFAPVGDGFGQTRTRQIDALADLGAALGNEGGRLWEMRNGYAMCSVDGLAAIDARLASLDEAPLDALRGLLRIGLHWDVEVTDPPSPGPLVSQAFCSALPVRYAGGPPALWARFATLVLEAAYEATLWAAVLNARSGASSVVLLTRLGGGVFGNDDAWIDRAMRRALRLASGHALDVKVVSYGEPSAALRALVREFE